MKTKLFVLMLASAAFMSYNASQAETMAKELAIPVTQPGAEAPITVTGSVGEIRDNEFDLIYGSEKITVELGNYGWSNAAADYLKNGESITVRGYMDNDFFEGQELDAFNITLNERSTNYYVTEYKIEDAFGPDNSTDGAYAEVTGTVQSIDNNVATIATKSGEMDVSFEEYENSPLAEDSEITPIMAGDRIYAYGEMNQGFFADKKVVATGHVKLN